MFLAVLAAFLLLQVVVPALRRLWQLPRRPLPAAAGDPERRRARGHRLAGGRLGVAESGGRVACAGGTNFPNPA